MSRSVFHTQSHAYAFGVDHAIGTFFQILDRPAKDAESPVASYNAQYGLDSGRMETLSPTLQKVLTRLRDRYIRAGDKTNLSEEDVIEVGVALGLKKEDFAREVYALWD